MAIGLTVFVAAVAILPLDNNDIWIHLTTGELILSEGSVPTTDRYSFTAAGNRYVAHEWLAAVLYAVGERAAGITGVVVAAKLLPAMALLGALWLAVSAVRAPPAIALAIPLLALTVVHRRIAARPELLALVLLLAVVWLLWRDREAARAGRSTGALYALVPIEILWVNVHGSFPLGIVLVGVFAMAEAAAGAAQIRDVRGTAVQFAGIVTGLAGVLWLGTREPAAFGVTAAAVTAVAIAVYTLDRFSPVFRRVPPEPRQGVVRLVGVAMLMGAAVLINPIGWEIYAFPFEFTAQDTVITTMVNEWKPLFLADHLSGSLALASFWIYVAAWCAALGLGVWRGRLGVLELALVCSLAILPLRHARWMGLFALATAPALVSLLAAARHAAEPLTPPRRVAASLFGIASVVVFLRGVAEVARMPLDPRFASAVLIPVVSVGVAIALAWRPGLSLARGSAVAAITALAAAVLSLVGMPEIAGIRPRPFARVAVGSGFGPSLHGLGATDFLRRHQVSGRLLTEYAWAGYAIHALWPRVTVFLDSRSEVYGEALLEELTRIKRDADVARVAMERTGVDLVVARYHPYPIARRSNRGLMAAIRSDPAWQLLYVDDVALAYGRRSSERPLPEPFEFFAPEKFRAGNPRNARPEFEAELRRAIAEAPASAFLRFALAHSLQAQGRTEDALNQLEHAWRANPNYVAASKFAAELARSVGRRAEARVWIERNQSVSPGRHAGPPPGQRSTP